MLKYGARVGLLTDLVYAEGTVVGYDLETERYEVEVDGYTVREWVSTAQFKILQEV